MWRLRACLPLVALVAMAPLVACSRPVVPLPSFALAPEAGRASLVVVLAPARPYAVDFLPTGAWDRVTATLARGGTAVGTASATAVLDPASRARTASLRFDGIAPGEGYTLTLAFSLSNGSAPPVAAGSVEQDGLSLVAGDNSLVLDARPGLTPTTTPGQVFGAFVESLPARGPEALMTSAMDIAPGRHQDYFYLDGSALHHLYKDAQGGWTTATVAGGAAPGFVDGAGATARFQGPSHLVVAPDGRVFVADSGNHAIRVASFDALGVATVTTLAGNGLPGLVDGTGAAAQLSSPQQLAFDADGNLVIADTGNNAVRLLTLAGGGLPVLSTIAGNGTSGYLDGPAASAQLNAPRSVAIDSHGTIFVGDALHPRLRMIAGPPGARVVSTVAGTGTSGFVDGPGATARLAQPIALCVDANNNVLVFDTRIRLVTIDATGNATVSTIAGSGSTGNADGPASAASLQFGHGMCIDADGSLLVARSYLITRITSPGSPDSMANRFVGFYPGGLGTTLAPSDGPVGPTAYIPTGLCVDAAGDLFTIEGDVDRFVEFPLGRPAAASLELVPTVADAAPDGDDSPMLAETSGMVTVDGLALYYAHVDGRCIERLVRSSPTATDLTETIVAGTPGVYGNADGVGAAASFGLVRALVQAPDGTLYCADNSAIRRIVVDAAGVGTVTTVAGATSSGFTHVDGPGTIAKFGSLLGLALDGQGNLFAADNGYVRKLVFAADGSATVSTVLNGATDLGPYSSVSTTWQGIAVDARGTLYLADATRIFAVTSDAYGQRQTTLFSGGSAGNADGRADTARYAAIAGLLYDPHGCLYVLDEGNALIRKITLR